MFLGIDIGGTKCAVLCGKSPTEIDRRIAFETLPVNQTLQKIYEIADEIGKFDAIGISCGGPLDEARGIIQSPPNLPGWEDIPIVSLLSERYGVPTLLRNDANACALAEYRYGAGRGTENMVFLTFGTGLGAGLILNGRLYSGALGLAGEVGHIRLSRDGPVGYGKAGSFEGFCSGGGIARLTQALARAALLKGSPFAFAKTEDEIANLCTLDIASAAKAGDPNALAVFKTVGERLGQGLSMLIDTLNPDAIVIGSVYARCEELLSPFARRVIEKEALPAAAAHCKLLPAALGEKIGDVAALTVAAEVNYV